jgi:Arf-GAP/SH3 domain/ANK repeat/PH domain-containing protein
MGNVTSKQGEADGSAIFLRDQTRCGARPAACHLVLTRLVSVAAVTVTNSRNRVLLHIAPNEYPATRYSTRRDAPEDAPVEYIQVRTLPGEERADRDRTPTCPRRPPLPFYSDLITMMT